MVMGIPKKNNNKNFNGDEEDGEEKINGDDNGCNYELK
jgi:hypothetical protein